MPAEPSVVLREIMAATDFSGHSGRAFEAALALAQHFGARLHIFHAARHASKQTMAMAKLEALSKGTEGTEIVKAVSAGPAAPEIVKYAERKKIDLIALGTHGRSGLTHVLMGSVAEAVVRDAPCQVLTIGPKAKTAKERDRESLQAQPAVRRSRCLVCAKPSAETICEPCKAHIRGQAIEWKRREELAGRRGLST